MKLILAAVICLVGSFALAIGCQHDAAPSTKPATVGIDAGVAP